MAHGTRLHTLEKRLPGPKPGLVGDVVNGVETVASDAVGVVTTAVSDVVELVSPEKSAAATTQLASTAGGSSSVRATATATSPNAATSSPSGGTTGGSSSGNDSGGGGSPASGSSSSNGGSDASSGNNGNNGTSGNSGNSDSGSTSDSGSDAGSSQVTGSSNTGAVESSSLINASSASGASPTTTGIHAALGSATSGVGSGSVTIASRSGTGLVNLVEPTSLDTSGNSANSSAVINAADSQQSSSASAGTRTSGTLQNSATLTGTSPRSSTTTTSSSGSGSGSGSGGDDGTVNGNGASSENRGGALSPGAIAGIVIACSLILIFLTVFVLRKWYRKRRARRFEHWVSRPGAFSFFGGAAVSINSEKERSIDGGRSGSGAGSGSGTRSARSSFGTSYDAGLRPLTPDSFFNAPSPASVSEIHASANTPTSFLTAPAVPPPVARSVEHAGNIANRQSLISLETSSSSLYVTDGAGISHGHSHANTSTEAVAEEVNGSADEHAQYLLAPPPHERGSPGGAQLSPISVRPWSPSERWAFPKPPQTAAQSTVYSTTPSPTSQSVHVEQTSASAHVPLSAVTTPTAEQDPFADAGLAATAPRRASDVSAATDSAVTAHTSASGVDELSGAIEQIRRPFVPTLADELRVNRGDVIRVLQVFDDGWVQIEILSRADSNNGAPSGSAAAATRGLERGLIPVDCLREAGEALPTFLASRRVSSYYGGVAI